MDQDVGVLESGLHRLEVGDEVGAKVALVELHAFDPVDLGFKGTALFYRDDSVLTDALHGLGEHVADTFVVVGSDATDLGDVAFGLDRLGHLAELRNACCYSGVDAALQCDRVCTRRHVAQAFFEDRFGQNRCGGGAVASAIVGLRRDFLHELSAHVLVGVLEIDFLCDRHAVFRDGGAAEGFLNDHVAAAGAEGDLDGTGELTDAAADVLARLCVVADLLSHIG